MLNPKMKIATSATGQLHRHLDRSPNIPAIVCDQQDHRESGHDQDAGGVLVVGQEGTGSARRRSRGRGRRRPAAGVGFGWGWRPPQAWAIIPARRDSPDHQGHGERADGEGHEQRPSGPVQAAPAGGGARSRRRSRSLFRFRTFGSKRALLRETRMAPLVPRHADWSIRLSSVEGVREGESAAQVEGPLVHRVEHGAVVDPLDEVGDAVGDLHHLRLAHAPGRHQRECRPARRWD